MRNERENVAPLLKDLKLQDYPAAYFEVIVVDDHSTDGTAAAVESCKMDNLSLVRLNEDKALNSYKKKAITIAIAQSGSELIITTDGDCRMGPKWISTIVDFYQNNGLEFISSPVAFSEEKSWFEKLQTIEFQYLIGIGAASIKNGSPNTCNGANLAYTRELFNELGGFSGIDAIASGDDELFLHKVTLKHKSSIGFLKHHDAVVYTKAKKTLPEFIQQRRRWASKSMKYTDRKIVVMVSLIFLYNLSLLLNAFLGFYDPFLWKILLFQLAAKIICDGAFIISTLAFFKKTSYIIFIPVILILYVIYILFMGFYSNFGGNYEWKGRSVR
jgi:cellulose synthase/poly-beta-1,6-N-acetylglucosamine synthase-like glycosyltransferase